MMRAENEAALRWLEGARRFARRESRWKLLTLLEASRKEVIFEIELAEQSGHRRSEAGLLDLVVIEDVGLREMLDPAPTTLADTDYLDKESVFFTRTKEIRVERQPRSLEFTVDEEIIGDKPASFPMIPQALKVIVDPGYTPEPEGGP